MLDFYSNFYIYMNFLLIKREVVAEKYRTEVFFVQTEPVWRGSYYMAFIDIAT
jgi:hypothetical protein